VKRMIATLATALLVSAVPMGCSRPGPYDVHGTATFQGKPIPIGLVVIEPDAERSNHGTQTQAMIKDGQFRTQPGHGAISGPVLITISANDGVPTPMSPKGKLLFRTYQFRSELPASSSSLNIEVPDSQAFSTSNEEPAEE